MSFATLVSFGGLLSLLSAQEPKLPPAMERAIHEIVRSGTGGKTPMFTLRPGAPPPAPRVCAVPLLSMRIDHPERFAIARTPVPKNIDVGIYAPLPAPPCEPGPAANPKKP